MVSALDCQIYDRGTIPAPDFPFRVALPVHPAVNGYRDLPWKLNAAERSADHIASLCAEIWKRWTANTHCRNMSTWTCPSGAAKFDFVLFDGQKTTFCIFLNSRIKIIPTYSGAAGIPKTLSGLIIGEKMWSSEQIFGF